MRGWCESFNSDAYSEKFPLHQKDSRSSARLKSKQERNLVEKTCKKDHKIVFGFEVEDTGCGMNLIFSST